ncbi:MAG TPA: ATP-dependent DNA helicase, partial [Thermoanaerobaculia bacterium]|nr:ATP-dependent DNA helicase [Thermoanaerobaculia bacterium]
FAFARRAWPYRGLTRASFDSVLAMISNGFATKRGRRGALVHRDEVNAEVRGRRGSRMIAIANGGAIPEVADYRVVLEPDDTFIGTINEDFAIESTAGDIFQLGNASWQIVQVASGVVRVADARGAPPTIPFWLGEAPARSDELSRAVSDLREQGVSADDGLPAEAAQELTTYFEETRRVLGVMPTQDTLVAERFFDESGGMQLVLHAPFGSRINRAWGLALRKRFCRQFNFELQAAATEDAVLLSLGPNNSFPLADVFRYLHPATARDVLVQAFLDAPVFQTRWRWNTTISLAIPRNRNGRKVPPPLQRAMADDLMAAVFPDAAACFENIGGDREIPDHPLVNQAVRDCLEEAMDFDGLAAVLARIHDGTIECVACDTPEPSPLSHGILNAAPYAFLDDAPLEERRTQAVQTRRASSDVGRLDIAAIERVRDEERPDPRDADELHDAMLTAGFLLEHEVDLQLFKSLECGGRATAFLHMYTTAERLPELLAIHDIDVSVTPPRSRQKSWSREEAIVELLRGRLSIIGPTTARHLANELAIAENEADHALLKLESEGVVLRGAFSAPNEWCDRRLLARIHRYTLNRLRAEIEPVTASDFMRFLFAWQHVAPSSRLTGIDGLREVVAQLDGFEVAASAWERAVLPQRIDRYESSMLDALSFAGEVGWARLSASATLPVGATPVALFLREHAESWLAMREASELVLSDSARRVYEMLQSRGASFSRDVGDQAAIAELVSAGRVASDGFAG